MSAKLLVIAGEWKGSAYPVAGETFRIGRDPQNDLSIPDASVSREHCVIERLGVVEIGREDFVAALQNLANQEEVFLFVAH